MQYEITGIDGVAAEPFFELRCTLGGLNVNCLTKHSFDSKHCWSSFKSIDNRHYRKSEPMTNCAEPSFFDDPSIRSRISMAYVQFVSNSAFVCFQKVSRLHLMFFYRLPQALICTLWYRARFMNIFISFVRTYSQLYNLA